MKRVNKPQSDAFTAAVEAIGNLCAKAFGELDHAASTEAMMAHSEIERARIEQKSAVFYRNFLPLRKQMVELLGDSYRRYFKLSLAHPSRTGRDSENWAWTQLQLAVYNALEWMRDWYILACEGENRRIQRIASVPFVPGQTVSTVIPTSNPPSATPTSWRAPSWLFAISPLVGVGPLKNSHVPAKDSGRLGEAHTRLLLKGAKRTLLRDLGAAIENVRDEEVAAAGAVSSEMSGSLGGQSKKPLHWLKGTKGLVRKSDLSKYTHDLTEKQQLAFSLRYEYALRLSEVASRMGLDRKTAYEHVEAAKRRIDQVRSNEKNKTRHTKNEDR